MNNYHIPVLLKEVIDGLKIEKGKKYIDATLGGGGHSAEIIKRGGIVLGLDADIDAVEHARKNFKFQIPASPAGRSNFKLRVVWDNFKNIDIVVRENGFEKVDGILFDLGLSSHQIDDRQRGFSYLNSSPLDMRMDQRLGVKASDLLNVLGKKELYKIFKEYGEEPKAGKIANRIIEARKIKAFESNEDLVNVLLKVYGFKNKTDFAIAKSSKRVFQALRIAVNDELGSLTETLPKALELLEENGRLVIITFHSLEDRIVKRGYLDFEDSGLGKIITKKPVIPGKAETEENSRSTSAKLRIFEKTRSAGSRQRRAG